MTLTVDVDGPLIRRSYDRLLLQRAAAAPGTHISVAGSPKAGGSYVVLYSMADAHVSGGPGEALRLEAGECAVLRPRGGLQLSSVNGLLVLVVEIPVNWSGAPCRNLEDVLGRVFSTTQGIGSLVGHLFDGISHQLEWYQPDNPCRLAHHIVGLLTLMCAEGAAEVGGSRLRLLEQAMEYVEAHLPDLDLSPDRIANDLNVSSRTLHRLFEGENLTISAWIRHRRLESCRIDLTDNALREASISDIGARWGLWDAAHFSRVFKATYGLSPRAYRLAASGRNDYSADPVCHVPFVETA